MRAKALPPGVPLQESIELPLRITRKGGGRDALAIHPKTAQRIKSYLNAPGIRANAGTNLPA
jgi:hypothetical protein